MFHASLIILTEASKLDWLARDASLQWYATRALESGWLGIETSLHTKQQVLDALERIQTKIQQPIWSVLVVLSDNDIDVSSEHALRIMQLPLQAGTVRICSERDLIDYGHKWMTFNNNNGEEEAPAPPAATTGQFRAKCPQPLLASAVGATRTSFVQHHRSTKPFFYDEVVTALVVDRRRVIVLYGPTGTGKTVCVQSVCEAHQLPLYELSTTSSKQEAEDLFFDTDAEHATSCYWLDASAGVRDAAAIVRHLASRSKYYPKCAAVLFIELDVDWRNFNARRLVAAATDLCATLAVVRCARPFADQALAHMKRVFPKASTGQLGRALAACDNDIRRATLQLRTECALDTADDGSLPANGNCFDTVGRLAKNKAEILTKKCDVVATAPLGHNGNLFAMGRDSTTTCASDDIMARIESRVLDDAGMVEELIHENMPHWASSLSFDALATAYDALSDANAMGVRVDSSFSTSSKAASAPVELDNRNAELFALWRGPLTAVALTAPNLSHPPVNFCKTAMEASKFRRSQAAALESYSAQRWTNANSSSIVSITGGDATRPIPGRSFSVASTSTNADYLAELALWSKADPQLEQLLALKAATPAHAPQLPLIRDDCKRCDTLDQTGNNVRRKRARY